MVLCVELHPILPWVFAGSLVGVLFDFVRELCVHSIPEIGKLIEGERLLLNERGRNPFEEGYACPCWSASKSQQRIEKRENIL